MTSVRERVSSIPPRQRALLVILGILVLLVVVYLLVVRGGGGPEGVTLRAPTTSPRPRSTASPTPSPSGAPEVFEVFEGKDPFEPLVGAPGPTAPPSPGATPPPTGGPSTGQRVELLDIFTESGVRFALVEVDSQEYKVKAGDTFAGSFRVLSLTARCGNFVFGDERFTLCIGQEVLK